MLVLSRKRGQVILLGSVELTVLKVGENRVVLGFNGPRDIVVRRAEKVASSTTHQPATNCLAVESSAAAMV